MMKIRHVLAMSTIVVLTIAAGCGKAGSASLAPCNGAQQRLWCKGVVNESTVARMEAGVEAPLCAIPFSATACVDRSDNRRAIIEFIENSLIYLRNYSDVGSGASPMIIVGDTVVWAGLPIKENGQVQCSAQPGNPWPSLPVVDLGSTNPPTFGPLKKPQGFGGFGTGGPGVGGFEEIGGIDQCMEPPVVTAPMCVASGSTCGGAMLCCPGTFCYATDVGSACM